MVISSRKKSQSRRKPHVRASRPSSTADWAVLFYIASDLKDDPKLGLKSLAPSLQHDVQEILQAGGSREVQIAVQHDHCESGKRSSDLPWMAFPEPKAMEVIDFRVDTTPFVPSGRATQ